MATRTTQRQGYSVIAPTPAARLPLPATRKTATRETAIRETCRAAVAPTAEGGGCSSELVVLLILLEQEVLAPVDSQARVSSLDQGDTGPVETLRRPAINLKIRF